MNEKNIKPVLVIRFPFEMSMDNFYEGMKTFERADDLKSDYHLLFTKDAWTGGRLEFECVNSNATEMELSQLQDKIMELITEQ
jgi:hypothetical protein